MNFIQNILQYLNPQDRAKNDIKKERLNSIIQAASIEENPITRLDQLRFGMALKHRIKERDKGFYYGIVMHMDPILVPDFGEGWEFYDVINPNKFSNTEITSGGIITNNNIGKIEVYQVPYNALKGAEEVIRYRLGKHTKKDGDTEPFSREEIMKLISLVND